MAIQTGNMPVRGTMNNMSYYKSKDGIMVKMKSVISKEKFKSEAFERTRRNQAEFGLAGKAAKTLRESVRTVMGKAKDSRLSSRLTTVMLQIAKTDTVSEHGQRHVTAGELNRLDNFEFNIDAALAQNIQAPYTFSIDRVTGRLGIQIPPFNPLHQLVQPSGATHFKLVSAGNEVDFLNGVFNSQTFETAELPVNTVTANLEIAHAVAPNSIHPLFLFLGIQYFEEINGIKYQIKGTNANSFMVVKVDTP